ncbi:hypothetical protein Gbth_024_225 [Gluconobacter thailandicus F149-1 = NBRC 100600]|uniref:Uncharacterized protein n=2 Tax=Gluconobacter thailandicus TaxID=257438 RepID=A0AAJ0QM96_GLUTH|nr:hypothetical protein [Gluconobacter thailandicus]AFW00038.1 hypothetical protein B932_0430 [Gluconobacter oxydans H24]ANQ41157.1 hypothetical protein BAR24_06635 [Gluconobacter oxydans]GAN88874.1 hypothetical protein Gbfr_001_091 [Gluconobacter frateurii M-2]KXV32491.1 hypothetical protein AD940_15740 [Gluconobacter thailandicus]KXV51792.1 hypothetical protein AD946_14850 [Gluconobacter thailandicus]
MASLVNAGKTASSSVAGRPPVSRRSDRSEMSALEKYRLLRETRKVVRRQRIEEEQKHQRSS